MLIVLLLLNRPLQKMIRLTVLCLAVLHFCHSANVPTDKENCDTKGINLYRAIGCAKEGDGCDAYKNCVYKQPVGHCLYQGHKIESGQNVKSIVTDSTCNFGCICMAGPNTTGEYICAQGQCGNELQGRTDCYLKYTLDKCCASQPPVCGETKSDVTCKVDDVVYKGGQRFSPNDKCVTCICTKDFKDDFTGPDCQPTPCDIEVRQGEELAKNCAPLYFTGATKEALCCPLNFICPSERDEVSKEEQQDGVCRYGDKTYAIGTVFNSKNDRYGKDRDVVCRCEAPPLFTCTMQY